MNRNEIILFYSRNKRLILAALGISTGVPAPRGPVGPPGPAGAPSTIAGPAGPPGTASTVPGPPGYTPVKGVDYNDGAPGDDGYTPIKGVDYDDGLPGAAFTYSDFTSEQLLALKGEPGEPGAPGSNALVTKESVEGVLTGEITTHSHDMSSKLNTTAFVGLSKITVGVTAPSAPATGDIWVDTN